MSLSQLFAKPLNPIPPRKQLWASPHPIYHFNISEKSKSVPTSKATSVETVSPPKPKDKIKEKEYHKSVLYSALRRPTVQEFLRNEYQKNPKRPSITVSGLTDSRQQLQINQCIANLSKAKDNPEIKHASNEKKFQPGYSASQEKNRRNKIICPISGDNKNSVNAVGIDEPPSTSGTPKVGATSDLQSNLKSAGTVTTGKDCRSNKIFSRPRFKTIVKNGSMVTIRLPPLKSNEPSKKNDCIPKEVGKIPVALGTPENTTGVVSACINKSPSQKVSLPKVSDSKPQNQSNSESCQLTINTKDKFKEFKLKEDVIPNTNEEVTGLDDVSQDIIQNKAVNKAKLLNLAKDRQKTLISPKTSVERLTMKPDLEIPEKNSNITKSKNLKKLDIGLTVVSDDYSPNKYQNEAIVANSQLTKSKYSPKQLTCFPISELKEKYLSLDGPCVNEKEVECQKTVQTPNDSQSSNAASNFQRHVDGDKLELENSVKQPCDNNSVLEINGKLKSENFDKASSSVVEQAFNSVCLQQQEKVKRLNINYSKKIAEQKLNTNQVDKLPSENSEDINNAMMEQALDNLCLEQLEKVNVSDINGSNPDVEHSTNTNVEKLDSDNSKQPPSSCVIVKASENLCLKQQEQIKSTDIDDTKLTVEHNDNTKMGKKCIEKAKENESFKKGVPGSDFANSQNTENQTLGNLSESDESLAELIFPGSDSQGEDDQEEIIRVNQSSGESTVCNQQKPESSDEDCEEGEILSSSEELEATECNSEPKTDPKNDVSGKVNSYETRSRSHNVGQQKNTLGQNGTQVSEQAERNAKTDTVTQKRKPRYPCKGPVKGKTKIKEPSLLDSVADAIVDVTVAADEKLDSRKTRGGSKEALKRKKKMYKARKRRLTWNKIPENSQVKYEALPPAVCKYYLMGTCSKGNECSFAHEGEVVIIKKKEVCKYYTTDCCTKGDDCHFLHSEFPCMFFHSSRCYRGDNCKFSHGPLTEEMKQALDKYIQENQQREIESQVATEKEKNKSRMEDDPGVQHGMVLRSQVQPQSDPVSTRYSPRCTLRMKETQPKNESHSNGGAVSESPKTDAALEVQNLPYNLRRKRALSEESEQSVSVGQNTPKAPKKDDGTTGKFFPGMYREIPG